MSSHIRANLWLLFLTVGICSISYPLALYVVGQNVFPHQANGSLIYDTKGKPIGSHLIAQQFTGKTYFQGRPSAASYNGAASGASNWGSNNYLLRDRVARSLADLAKFGKGEKEGQDVAPDVIRWFRDEKPGLVAEWAKTHTTLAQNWVKSEDATKEFVITWMKSYPTVLEAWNKENPDKSEHTPEDLAVAFFESFSKTYPATWLTVTEVKDQKNDKGEPIKRIDLVKKEDSDTADIAQVFFDSWRQAHPDVLIQDVPADLVMASASGLDPHITLAGALYQIERVSDGCAEVAKLDKNKVRNEIEQLLRESTIQPLNGFAGVPLINVLEVNIVLRKKYSLP